MRVHHLAAYHGGGAGIAAQRLNSSLERTGITSKLFVGDWHGDVKGSIRSIAWEKSSRGKLSTLVNRLGNYIRVKILKRRYLRGTRGYFSLPWKPSPTLCSREFLSCDVLHLHWIARLVDMPSFFGSIPGGLPIAWTLHDMNPLTGGCHHADACDAYQRGCGSCPMLHNRNQGDLSQQVYCVKEAAFRSRAIHLVAPSLWMEKVARQSPLMQHVASIRTIYNGLEIDQFHRVETSLARRRLGIVDDALVVGYGAESLANKRKGVDEFITALKLVAKTQRVVGLLFGKCQESVQASDLDLRTLGYLSNPAQLSEAYSAMNVFVAPSHAEILGQSILESMACQTPVVAFDVGGIPESISHKQTGYLCSFKDTGELAEGILWMLADPERACAIGRNCRLRVAKQFDASKIVDQYVDLYKNLSGREP